MNDLTRMNAAFSIIRSMDNRKLALRMEEYLSNMAVQVIREEALKSANKPVTKEVASHGREKADVKSNRKR